LHNVPTPALPDDGDPRPWRALACPTCTLSTTELLERRPGCAACLVRARRARTWLADWPGAPLWD
jgi:hypothetical protein